MIGHKDRNNGCDFPKHHCICGSVEALELDAEAIGHWVATQFSCLTLNAVVQLKDPINAAGALITLQLFLAEMYMEQLPKKTRKQLMVAVRESKAMKTLRDQVQRKT